MRRLIPLSILLLALPLGAWPSHPWGGGAVGAGGTLPAGTVSGQTLTWNNSTIAWNVNANATCTAAGACSAATTYTVGTFEIVTPKSLTIADNGNGSTPATSTSTPTGSEMAVTCSDAQGCEWTIGETSITSGASLVVTNVGTNRLALIHSANVVELAKASRQTLMGGASVELLYDADRWTQTGQVIDVSDGTKTLTSVNSPYALLYTDKVLICDTTGGDIEIDVTPAAEFDQTRVVSFLKLVAGNNLIIDPNGSENLNGSSSSKTLTTAESGLSITSDGTDLWGF